MDFMSEMLSNGIRFRALNIVDGYSRECQAIKVDTLLPGIWGVRVFKRSSETRRFPRAIVVDNGPGLNSTTLDEWSLSQWYPAALY